MGKVLFRERVHPFQIDINGHVNNAVYVQWLEVGRVRLLEAAGHSLETMRERGFLAVVVETWIQYREPLHYPDTVRGEVWVEELTHVTARMAFRLTSERTGRVVARATQRGVFLDAVTNRPFRLGPEDREAFDAVLLADERP